MPVNNLLYVRNILTLYSTTKQNGRLAFSEIPPFGTFLTEGRERPQAGIIHRLLETQKC